MKCKPLISTSYFTGFQVSYDSNGNMITNDYASDTLTYDDENRLTMVSSDTFHSFRGGFIYDGLGRMRERVDYGWNGSGWIATNTVLYIYDGWRVIQERDGSNNPLTSYTRGSDLSGTLEGAGGIGGLLALSGLGQTVEKKSTAQFHSALNFELTLELSVRLLAR